MKSFKPLSFSLFAACVFAGTLAAEPVKYSQRETFDFGWKFAKFGGHADCLAPNDPGADAAKPGYSDGKWRKLDLPHDWGVESRFLPQLPNQTASLPWNAVGWYRKEFSVPAKSKGNRFYLDFDGVMMTPQVYVNGKLAGEWKYGYNSFRVDITDFLKFGGTNVVAVRAENLPNSTRWYPGAGIYRHTWITESNPVHIENWGVFVTTPKIDGLPKINDKKPPKELKASSAKIATATTVVNKSSAPAKVEVLQEIYPLGGAKAPLASRQSSAKTVPAGESATIDVETTLSSPKLWDVVAPSLYVLRTTILLDGQMTDRKDTVFGVRKAEWKTDGFFLNGRRVQIRGVCQHHDLGPLGGAVHKRAIERQIEVLKSFGTNSIRTSHNPPAPELLDLCDRMGILVDAELFDCWKYTKEGKANGYNLFWNEWRERDVRNFVLRDRNHPSVIAWSAGNEIEEQGARDGREIARELVALFKKYDATRPVTVGCNDLSASWNGFGKEFDVYGFNYKPNNYKDFANKNKQPFVASETASCVSTRGFYSFPADDNFEPFWKRNFCDNIATCQVSDYGLYAPGWSYAPDVEFGALEDEPRCAGEYVWTGFDYLGEPTPWNLGRKPENDFRDAPAKDLEKMKAEMEALKRQGSPARSSYFGIVDLCGFWKDRTYIYRAHWIPDKPMAHILPHWNWKGLREGKTTPVFVYTNGDKAELFLNGKSLGKREKKPGAPLSGKDMNGDQRERFRLTWMNVKYEPGTLKVVAYKNGKKWAEDVVETTDAPAKFTAEADRTEILGDGRDLSYVKIAVTDAKGRVVPTASNKFKFSVTGPAEIVGVCNGSQTDHDSMKGTELKAFNGLVQVILRSKRDSSGKATLKISGEKIGTQTLDVTVKKPTARQLKTNT
ncbi:MAG: glycoside hydrolase family 2 TIM barrel-domain containing protein [Candidatus Spyradosoma sp.]